MYTYQELVKVGEDDKLRMEFVLSVINSHKHTEAFEIAKIAQDYAQHKNTTITNYRKLLYTISGQAVPDNFSANFKIASSFFNRFVTQQVQFLLGNGVTWENEATGKALGNDFDSRLQDAGKKALIGGVSFGFMNYDHLEVFSINEFCPLYDEENGALMAGVRFWQIDGTKPLRATLYEVDGLTEYIWVEGEGTILKPKSAYKTTAVYTEADGVTIFDGENYPTFPIVPLWANSYKQSEIIGIREEIDAYDLIKSGFANDLDDVSQIFWTVSNAGGMDDIDLAQFVQRMKTVKAANLDDGQTAESHTIDIPYAAREALLDRLRKDMYRDYMALDTDEIANGAVTATQIKAAYEPLNAKADEFEYCVIDFIQGLLAVLGIEDNPTFTRSYIVNQSEEIQNLVSAGEFLDQEYITGRILTILGDTDKVEEVLTRMAEDEVDRGFVQGEEIDE